MRITLASPPLISNNPREPLAAPLGLAYLGASLEQAGFEATLIDGPAAGLTTDLGGGRYRIGATPDQLAELISDSHPDLIGLSCPFTTRYSQFQELTRAVRERLPRVPIIAGGIHPTIAPERVLQRDALDLVVLGEGELTLVELARRFADHGKLDPEGLDGVAWRDGDKVKVVPRTSYTTDLDALPRPAWHLLPMEQYLRRSGGRWSSLRHSALPILTSRSCPGRCSFCSVHLAFGPKWRGHSPQRVLEELSFLSDTYHPSLIAFEDDRLTWDRQRLLDICRGIRERELKTRWHTPNGVHVADLDEELLTEMKRAGCHSLNLAIESGDPGMLNEVIGKKASPEQAREVAWACHRLGIRANAYFVIGMPGETDQTIQRSLDLCLELPLDGLGVFIATPFPGTRMFEQLVKAGYISADEFAGRFLEGGDPDLLHQPLFDTPTMSRERLVWWEREFQRQFLRRLHRRKPLTRVRGLARAAYRMFARH